MKERWEEVSANPRYLVSNLGNVYNMKRRVLIQPSRNAQGIVKVGLTDGSGVQVTHPLAHLVAQAFVENFYDPDIFKTPIHLDGDKENCRADNLAWRPRWFAVKYHQQVNDPQYLSVLVDILDTRGNRYNGPLSAAVCNGTLVSDVIGSYSNITTQHHPTFPTGLAFFRK